MPVARNGGSVERVKVAGVWGPRQQENLPAVRRLADATDGLSNTALVIEQCATHEDHRLGREPSISGDYPFHSWINESDKGSYVTIGPDGRYAFVSEGTLVNGANGHNLYSFHPGGVQIALCDGSVQFVAESTDWLLVESLITAESQEPSTGKAWK